MRKLCFPLCAILLSSFILSGCTDAQIASYAKQNGVTLTPDQIKQIQNSQKGDNGNGKGNGNGNVPVIKIGQGNNAVTIPLDTAVSALKGADGAQGAQGERGEKGERGERGSDGSQGEKGEKGDKGDKGDKGEQGEQGIQGVQGEKGDTGRGIDHMQINSEGHLIAYYTDGTSEDCGTVNGDSPAPITPDFEKVGYVISFSDPSKTKGHFENNIGSFDYEISSDIKLVDINNNNPSKKYHYSGKVYVKYRSISINDEVQNLSVYAEGSCSIDGATGYGQNSDTNRKINFGKKVTEGDMEVSQTKDWFSSIPNVCFTDVEITMVCDEF